ncbi:M23 family metallopeptidase [Paractinoplanes toevensis]|uniref:Peptidase n=1 Tax=Paractinoplanes toevensis TaxID=571911 RepID=A0A919T7T3_9ACTN|nr:M23 family metallopeptidase [Actinoplanes toevensis]GIM90984.1 peptidase [Actinoplanes toevensis]
MARLIARIRVPLLVLVALVLIGQPLLDYDVPFWVTVPALIGAFALYAWVGRVCSEPIAVESPVEGPWRAVNSPASRVPSHGLHAYGQTYAIDLVFDPPGRSRPVSLAHRPADFPGFGRPVRAAAAGRVVRVRQGQRDHWSRTSVPGLLYLLAEGAIRELLGAGRVIGNHVVVDLGENRYALYAHLQRHSVTVRAGDHVAAGQPIANCGNSGNSAEPHLHFQLMDRPSPTFAAGLPFRFTTGTPRNGELLRSWQNQGSPGIGDGAA